MGRWCRALRGGSSAGESAWQRSPPQGGSRRAAPAPRLPRGGPAQPDEPSTSLPREGCRAKSAQANQGRLSAALITVTKYLRGQQMPGTGELFNQIVQKMAQREPGALRACTGTSEDDEGRTGGAASSPSFPGAAGDLPGLGTPALGLLLAFESMGFMCFQRISCI